MNRVVADAVNPGRIFMRKQWNAIGSPLLRCILDTSEKCSSAIGTSFCVVSTLRGLYALQAIVDNVHDEIVKKLSEIDQDMFTTTLVLEQYAKMEKEKARIVSAELASLQIDLSCIVKLGNLDESRSERDEIGSRIKAYGSKNGKVGSFLNTFLDKFMEESFMQIPLNLIIKSVSDKITEQIAVIIDAQLLSSLSTIATSALTNALSQRIQHYCLVDEKQNTDSMNEDQKRPVLCSMNNIIVYLSFVVMQR